VLGPRLLSNLGYDFDELAASLETIECRRGGPVARWQRIFPDRMTRLDKLILILISLVQHQHVRESGRQILKVLAGRL
jgi:hypothetical protein